MLDIKKIRDNFQDVKERLGHRGNESYELESLFEKDTQRRQILNQVEELKRERNAGSSNISLMVSKKEDVSDLKKKMQALSLKIKGLDDELRVLQSEINQALLRIPNIPADTVPLGTSEEENAEVRKWGEPAHFSFEVRSHVDIGERLDILDFKRASKIAGSRFVLSKGDGAKLERALINFMLDVHTNEHGYREVIPPFLVNEDTMTGTGQLPKFKEDLFYIDEDHFYLIPTAEVPVTNIYKDEILSSSHLPVYFAAYTPCFRREAGSYGKDTVGLIRQHQFNKVELVKFVEPESSFEELEKLLSDAEEVLKRLKIPYRVVELCAGDLGFSSAKTYDIEVWMPHQKKYREISSCSNFLDFQARRARIRFRKTDKSKPEFVHTLNGSGVAVGRLVVAILENYQNEDGSVIMPEALIGYMGGIKTLNVSRLQST